MSAAPVTPPKAGPPKAAPAQPKWPPGGPPAGPGPKPKPAPKPKHRHRNNRGPSQLAREADRHRRISAARDNALAQAAVNGLTAQSLQQQSVSLQQQVENLQQHLATQIEEKNALTAMHNELLAQHQQLKDKFQEAKNSFKESYERQRSVYEKAARDHADKVAAHQTLMAEYKKVNESLGKQRSYYEKKLQDYDSMVTDWKEKFLKKHDENQRLVEKLNKTERCFIASEKETVRVRETARAQQEKLLKQLEEAKKFQDVEREQPACPSPRSPTPTSPANKNVKAEQCARPKAGTWCTM